MDFIRQSDVISHDIPDYLGQGIGMLVRGFQRTIVVRPCLTKAPIFSATPLVASVRTSRTTSLRPPLVVSTYCSFSSTLMSRLMAKLTGMHRSPKEVIDAPSSSEEVDSDDSNSESESDPPVLPGRSKQTRRVIHSEDSEDESNSTGSSSEDEISPPNRSAPAPPRKPKVAKKIIQSDDSEDEPRVVGSSKQPVVSAAYSKPPASQVKSNGPKQFVRSDDLEEDRRVVGPSKAPGAPSFPQAQRLPVFPPPMPKPWDPSSHQMPVPQTSQGYSALVNRFPPPLGQNAPLHYPPPTGPQRPQFQATPIQMPGSYNPTLQSTSKPQEAGEFDAVDRVEAKHGEGDWNDLLTNIHTSVEEGLKYDEADAFVPGFAPGIKLKPWQVHGRHWMLERETGRKHGGILADDMGLGKTIQAITLITLNTRSAEDKKKGHARGTLIITPLNIMPQWENEIKKFNPNLRVRCHHGPGRAATGKELEQYDVVLTTYDIASSEHGVWQNPSGVASKGKSKASKVASTENQEDGSDSDGFGGALQARKAALLESVKSKKPAKEKEKTSALFHVNWFRIILDEAQNAKNKNSKRALAASSLYGKHRWVLTGTPIQNNIEELYSILRFLRISPLDSWERFNTTIRKPIQAGRSATPMKRLHLVLSAIMLRRLKADIPDLNLPQRLVHKEECEFEEAEQFVYDQLSDRAAERLREAEQNNDMMSALVLLLRLRQACDHPLLTKGAAAEALKETRKEPSNLQSADDSDDELTALMNQMAVSGKCENCNQTLKRGENQYCAPCEAARRITTSSVSDPAYRSTKLRKIIELLDMIDTERPGTKTIIFSDWVQMLLLVGEVLKEEKRRFVKYDGGMNAVQRKESLMRITEDPNVKIILISTKAGNSGLNLTCCSNVILLDPWWNPAIEDQAFDRAHRIGQTRDVFIYKLVVPDTVEDRILDLQEKKRQLAKAALEGGKITKGMRLRMDELMNLFVRAGHED